MKILRHSRSQGGGGGEWGGGPPPLFQLKCRH